MTRRRLAPPSLVSASRYRAGKWLVLCLFLALHTLLLACLLRTGAGLDFLEAPPASRAIDFDAVASAGQRAWRGKPLYERQAPTSAAEPPPLPFRYPPAAAYSLAAVLGSLPPGPAPLYWLLAVETALWVTALVAVYAHRTLLGLTISLIVWLLSPAVLADLWLGQFSLVAAIGVLWALLLWGRHRHDGQCSDQIRLGVGGVVWIIAVILKGAPLVCAAILIADARLRRYLWAALLLLAATTAGYFAAVPGDIANFLRLNVDPSATWISVRNVGTWNLFKHVALRGQAVDVQQFVGSAFMAAMFAAALWRTARSPGLSSPWLLGLWTSAFLVGYREVWLHHYCFLLPFTSLAVMRLADDSVDPVERRRLLLALGMSIWAQLPNPFQVDDVWALRLWRPIPTLALFILLALPVHRGRVSSR